MKQVMQAATLVVCLLVCSSSPLQAVLTFTQLDENTFTVSHRVKGVGSRGKATKLVYTKAASLCLAAGYSHYLVLGQESQAHQQYQAANATLTVKFFQTDGEGRTECEGAADSEYVADAEAKLREQGYRPPEQSPPSDGPSSSEGTGAEAPCPAGCTLEQIAAMARAGLSDGSIRAACQEEAQTGPSRD